MISCGERKNISHAFTNNVRPSLPVSEIFYCLVSGIKYSFIHYIIHCRTEVGYNDDTTAELLVKTCLLTCPT